MKKIITTFLIAIISFTSFAANYHISEAGKEFIKNYEKCSLTAYYDSNGYTIGYGHHSKDVYAGMKITKKEADAFFDEDIKKVEKSVNRLLDALPYDYEFSQGFIDGLCSFVYNTGEGGAKKSEFYKRLCACRVVNGKMNVNDYNFTIAGIKSSRISCKGHIKRRYEEHKLMLG